MARNVATTGLRDLCARLVIKFANFSREKSGGILVHNAIFVGGTSICVAKTVYTGEIDTKMLEDREEAYQRRIQLYDLRKMEYEARLKEVVKMPLKTVGTE